MLFSDLIDEIAHITLREGEEEFITSVTNGAFRELQSKSLFSQDLVELRIDTKGASVQPFMWREVPKNLRAIQYVRYSNGVSPVPVKLGRKVDELAGNFYYLAGNYIAFSGVPLGGQIDLAYYRILPRLQYFSDREQQPAKLNDSGEWLYKKYNQNLLQYEWVPTLGDWESDMLARDKVTNWILDDYYEAAKAIAVREIFNVYNDTANSSVWTAIAKNHTTSFLNLTKVKGIYT